MIVTIWRSKTGLRNGNEKIHAKPGTSVGVEFGSILELWVSGLDI